MFRLAFYLSVGVLLLLTPAARAEQINWSGYRRFILESPQRTVHTVAIDRTCFRDGRCQITPGMSAEKFIAPATLSNIISGVENGTDPGSVLTAINGTLYSKFAGLSAVPRGPLVINGKVVALSTLQPTHPAFGISMNSPWLGELQIGLQLIGAAGERITMGLNAPVTGVPGILFTLDALGEDSPARIFTADSLAHLAEFYLLVPVDDSKYELAAVRRLEDVRLQAGEYLVYIPLIDSSGDELTPPELRVNGEYKLEFLLQTQPVAGNDCLVEINNLNELQFATGTGLILLESNSGSASIPEYIRQNKGSREPKAALCWNASSLYFVAVDGQRPGLSKLLNMLRLRKLSAGMSAWELATLMRDELGCSCGFQLDGGKTATLYHEGSVINHPAAGVQLPTNAAILVRRAVPVKE